MDKQEFMEIFNNFHVPHDPEELYWLVNMVETLNPKAIIEIGVEGGGSFRFWDRILPPKGILIGIDPQHPKTMVKWDWKNSDRDIHVIEGRSGDPEVIAEVTRLLWGISADFLFIDAEHTSEAATRDFRNYHIFVRQGGFVGFHDINDIIGFWNRLQGEKQVYFKNIGTGVWRKP